VDEGVTLAGSSLTIDPALIDRKHDNKFLIRYRDASPQSANTKFDPICVEVHLEKSGCKDNIISYEPREAGPFYINAYKSDSNSAGTVEKARTDIFSVTALEDNEA
jgi:hypothetical protein